MRSDNTGQVGPSRRIRVLHIITWLDRGGAQDHLLGLLRGLDRGRYDLTVAAGTAHGDRGGLAGAVEAAARTVRLRHLRREVAPANDLLAVIEIGRLMDRFRPDVVHTHSSKAGVVGRLAASGRPVRTVHNVHGWSFSATLNPFLLRVGVNVERRLAAGTDVMLNVSEADRKLGDRLGISARVANEVVRGGIDLSRFEAVRYDRGERTCSNRVVIGTVGRLTPAKDPTTALQAMRLLVDEHPGVRFRWIGDGPLRADVEQTIRSLGLEKNVELAGASSDVPSELASLDVFVLSSRFEGLPRSVMEAMAAGVPVVATDVGGVGELVVDGRTGRLVQASDPVGLAMAVKATVRDPESARSRALAGIDAIADYSAETMCARTADVYERLVT